MRCIPFKTRLTDRPRLTEADFSTFWILQSWDYFFEGKYCEEFAVNVFFLKRRNLYIYIVYSIYIYSIYDS